MDGKKSGKEGRKGTHAYNISKKKESRNGAVTEGTAGEQTRDGERAFSLPGKPCILKE